MEDGTILDVFERTAGRLADRPALRRRVGGAWETLSWADYARAVREARCEEIPPAPPVGGSSATVSPVRPNRVIEPSRVVTIAPSASRGRGMWLQWNGQAWRASGAAVRVGPQFVAIGTLNGRTVFRGPDGDGTIWVETAQGLASPWKIQHR